MLKCIQFSIYFPIKISYPKSPALPNLETTFLLLLEGKITALECTKR